MNCSCIIVIPCYNEEQRFPIESFTAYAEAHPEIGFLLVNDGSKDRTIDVLNRARAGREEQVGVLDQKVNGGKSEAVRAGMLTALRTPGCRYAGFWDADLATPLETIPDFIAVLDSRPGLAMVFGARVKLLGRWIERRAIRHYLGRVFATTVSVVLRLPIYDTQCGAKLFRVEERTHELFEEPFLSRWIFDVEIIARYIRQCDYEIRRVEKGIYEFPLMQWEDVAGSRVRPRDFFRAFFDILKIHRHYGK